MNSMKHKTKSILACSLVALIAVTAVIPAFAASDSIGSSTADVEGGGQLAGNVIGKDTTQGQQSTYKEREEGTYSSEVYASQNSKYTVTLPKVVVLNGEANTSKVYSGDYTIKVEGDIAGTKTIDVNPFYSLTNTNADHFVMSQTNKDDIKATVNQTKTAFGANDLSNANKTSTTTGTVSAKDLTAGSWKGKFYFDVNLNEPNAYYSTLALAVQDINGDTINTDTSVADSQTAQGAVCGVYKESNDVYRIEIYKDIDNQESITINKNVKMDLNDHTITFATGNYLTYTKDFSIYDGTLNSTDSNYTIFGAKDNTNSTFTLNDVTINQNVSENISSASIAIDISSSVFNITDYSVNAIGNGSNKYNVNGFISRNETNETVSTLTNYTYNSTLKNSKLISGSQISGAVTIKNPIVKIKSVNSKVIGLKVIDSVDRTFTPSPVIIEDGDINLYTENSSCGGMTVCAEKGKIVNTTVYADDNNNYTKTDTVASRGIATFGETKVNSEITIENCTVYGKQWGIQAGAYNNIIKNCNVTATNHTGYILGNANIYNSTFKTANRDKYASNTLDNQYGFYIGTPNSVNSVIHKKDNIVNIYNCEIGNPVDTSGVNVPNCGVTAKYNGYYAPKEINIYDSIIYEGKTSVFSFNASSPYTKNYTKFNLYGSTKLMANSTTELSLEQVSNDIDWFTNITPDSINYSLQADWESSKDEYIYYGGNVSPNKLIDFRMYCTDKAPKSQAYEDWANVYDYR